LQGNESLAIPLTTEQVHLIKHPLQKSLSRSRGDAGTLEHEDFVALAAYLGAHALDFRADKVQVRHVSHFENRE
jgi:hypothetical protein